MKFFEKPKILMVDDKQANLLVIENLLEGEECELLKAESGHKALDLVLDYEFALVLMDVQMPVMDGFETARLMRGIEKTRHLPIIFITALNRDSNYLSTGYETGAVDYLFKPVNPVALKGKVQVFLDLYTQRKVIEKQSVELKERVQESQAAQEEAERANRAKSEFLSNMSHELRTPLNAILGFAQVMRANTLEPLEESNMESVDQILQAGNHLLALINDVLDLSHIESGKFTLSLEEVDAASVLEEVKLILATLAENRSITLVDELGEDFNFTVMTDRLRLKQVLLNLGSNAVKYNRENGTVTLSYEVLDNDFLRINIIDTGPGIPEDKQQFLFQPFNRLDMAFSGIEGTGIGLTIVKKLIELMNGKVGFETAPNKGTLFYVDLPLVLDANKRDPGEGQGNCSRPAKNPREPEFDGYGKKLKVLYAEDNPANIKLVQKMMAHRPGIELIIVKDGKTALNRIKNLQPTLILLDIHIPGMTGIQVVKEIRKTDKVKDIPVVAISASALKDQVQKAMDAGFDEYLTKPIDFGQFLELLDRYVATGTAQASL